MRERGVKSRWESKKDEHVRRVIGQANVSRTVRGGKSRKTDGVMDFPERSNLSSLGYKMGAIHFGIAHDRI